VKAILDVHYEPTIAHAACVVFEHWSDERPVTTHRLQVPGVRPYRPGRFFERELPPLLAILEATNENFDHIIVDGYVYLEDDAVGLGGRLYESLPRSCAVIGVAKKPLAIADQFEAIHRGRSSKPLFVSAIGLDAGAATTAIASMHGPHRIPTLLHLTDRIARGN
jgi:deoxyribonuclease V